MRRDELLKELGLMPWRLRGTAASEDTSSENAEPPAVQEVAPPQNRQQAAETTEPTNQAKPLPREERREAPWSPSAGMQTEAQTGTREEISPEARAQRIAQLSWDDFAADVAACTACGLCKTRNKPVPGVGDVHARWLFVGEGPGAEEDKKGEPFVGQAGRLLDQMLAALGMKRGDDVYIGNVLKCRPPNNRAPTPQEADACRPYLERQIALIQPKIIVALGKSAAMLLLNTEASIASLRGRVHRYRDVPLVVTYHPAYLLRSPADKAKSWEDLVFAKRELQKVAEEAL